MKKLDYRMMLLPESGDCQKLFFRSADTVQCTEQMLVMPAGTTVSFDAYYNLFPAKVYREYTNCKNFTFRASVYGSGNLSVCACDEEGGLVWEECRAFCHSETAECCIRLVLPENAAAVWWRCTAETECRLEAASLMFPEPPERDPILAVGICTYRREEFVKRNAAKIAAFFERIGSNSHHLYISDNGNTLSGVLPECTYMNVVHNPNTGGSGGFARVMQETLQSRTNFTHLLLMDDDVDFRPEILERLLLFLSRLREEYAHSTVGGAMCMLDAPWMQFEAGAKFQDGGALQGLMQNLDLRDLKSCIRNAAATQEADYNSWWCCCISVEKLRSAGLPMPFFFKMDDVEYALRLKVPVICLPGVCVAHESFIKKYNSALEYYITRNTLITAALHDRLGGRMTVIRRMCSAVLRNTILQRYETAELILRAHRDFLQGADFLKNTDDALLHQEIMGYTPKSEPAPEGTKLSAAAPVSRVLRLLSLGGMLLPCKRDSAVVDAFFATTSDAFRVKEIVHFYPMTGRGYRTRRDRKRAAEIIGSLLGVSICLFCRAGAAAAEWKSEQKLLSSNEFWTKKNGLPAQKTT